MRRRGAAPAAEVMTEADGAWMRWREVAAAAEGTAADGAAHKSESLR